MKVQLINCSGYKLPVTKRIVSEKEVVEVNECEYEKIKDTGKFITITDDNVDINGFFIESNEPENFLPQDWTGKNVCLKIVGGLGDVVVVASLVASLKTKECLVTLAIRDNQMELFSKVEGVKDVIDASDLNNPKIKSKYDIVLDLNHAFIFGGKIVDLDYYKAVHKKAGIEYTGGTAKFNIEDEPIKFLPNPIVAIHTGASNPIRRWSNEKWKTLAYSLVSKGLSVLFFGDITDFSFEDVNIRVASLLTRNLVKQTQMLKQCSYFIGNDSGFCHLAGVLGLSGQVLFFSTKEEHVIGQYKKLRGISKYKELKVEPTRNIVNYDPNYIKCCDAINVNDIILGLPDDLKNHKARNKYKSKPDGKKILNQTLIRSQLNKVSKLLFIMPDVNHGGGEKATLTLITELSKYFKIDLININHKNKISTELNNNFVRKYTVLGEDKVKELTDYISNNPYDAILYYDWTDLVTNVLQELPLRPPVISICHTEDSGAVNIIRNIKHQVDKVVSVSKNIALDLSCEYIPSPVDISRLNKTHKLSFKFDNDLPVVGYVGRFDTNKNVVWLIENLAKINANLILVGATDCTEIERLYKLAGDLGVKDKLCILPKIDDISTVYNSFSRLVLASNYEACPLAVLEACILNIPVLSTKVGILEEVFKDRSTINFFSLDTASLNKAIEDTNQLDTDEAKNLVLENFSPGIIGVKYRKLIRKLLGSVWPSYIQEGDIKLTRKSGGGDIIMASSVFKKARETFPNAVIHVNVPSNYNDLVKNNPYIDGLVEEGEPCDISFDLDYYDCWKENLHAAEGMGGNTNELSLHIDKERPIIKGSVGIWAYQHHRSIKPTKQLSEDKWKIIVEGLKFRGIPCYQLGATFEKRMDFIPNDMREIALEDSIKNLASMEVILCVDCIAQHAARALGLKCVVLWGGSGHPGLCGYESHTNLFSKTDNKCLASVCHSTYGQPGCCKDGTCTNNVDTDEVIASVLNLIGNKNGPGVIK
jgi:ADP-heptose:LPS heptosyltransferase